MTERNYGYFLDTDIYLLKLAANDVYKRDPIGRPHCDCKAANEAFFDESLSSVGRDGDYRYHTYTMVPVEIKSGGLCVHCGFYTILMPEQSYKQLTANRLKGKRNRVEGKDRSRAIVGINTVTGDELNFRSIKDAVSAGYGDVATAVRLGRITRKVWKWIYA